jgi:HAMP domain-containing protein
MIRWSMNTRFKVGSTICVAMVVLIGVMSLYHLHILSLEISGYLDRDSTISKTLQTAIEHHRRIRDSIFTEIRQVNQATLSDTASTLAKLSALLSTGPIAGLAGTSNLLTGIGSLTADLQAINSSSDGPNVLQLLAFLERVDRSFDDLRVIETAHGQETTANQRRIAGIARGFQTRMGIIALLTTAIVLFLAVFFSFQISLPVRRLQDIISSIRDGDYTVPVRARGKDEVGVLVAALAHMVEHVRARDSKKMQKIDLEKRRFAALVNALGAPVLLINRENRIAFANDEFLGNFHLTWNDVYEISLPLAGIPKELKERIEISLKTRQFPLAEKFDIITEAYAFDLTLTFLPVFDDKDQVDSLLCILGPIPPKNSKEINKGKK